jgi:hypothetical protein
VISHAEKQATNDGDGGGGGGYDDDDDDDDDNSSNTLSIVFKSYVFLPRTSFCLREKLISQVFKNCRGILNILLTQTIKYINVTVKVSHISTI